MRKKIIFVMSLITIFISAINCSDKTTAQQDFEKGLALLKENKKLEAFAAFKSAARKAPDSAIYYIAAANVAPDQNTALLYTNFAWEKGLKTKEIFLALLKLTLHATPDEKLNYALTLFKELPESVATNIFRGELFFEFGKYDSAYSILYSEFQKEKKGYLCPKIATSLVKLGKLQEAIKFLYNCSKEKVLDSEGYAHLAALLSMDYRFNEVDSLFSVLEKSNYYNDQLRLEQATYLVFNNRFREAEPLINRPIGPEGALNKAIYKLRFNTLAIYSAIMDGKKELADSLLSSPYSDTIFKENISLLYKSIKSHINKDTAAYASLKELLKKLPQDPVITIFTARAALINKKFKEALEYYEKLPGIVMWTPPVLVERAQVMALVGEEDKALSIISLMHSHHIFTRQSLELFRNLTLKKDLVDKSEAAQRFLEEKYSNDVKLKWQGLLLAIKSQKIDSAISIANKLAEAYPEEERFKITYLRLLLVKKEYNKVISEINKSSISDAKLKPIEAEAWKALGDTAKAVKCLEEAINKEKDRFLMMQLAQLYFELKLYDKAINLYNKLIESTPDSLKHDNVQMAILLNNNAWTIYASGTRDLSDALKMAKRAYELLHYNINILDTYTAILFKMGNYKECIKVLEENKASKNERALLYRIAMAYEKIKNKNKAKRYLEDALQTKVEEQKIRPFPSDEEINNKISEIVK
ncbi:MAG: tetratricopeptide repeat protein [Chitinispirillaceae bacterium]|nr:tetratricopeptide repeat protein [Chitinispirillaceae bacterium]